MRDATRLTFRRRRPLWRRALPFVTALAAGAAVVYEVVVAVG